MIGGSHVSFWDENALKEYPQLDVVVRKEGENTIVELMERIEAGKPYYDVVGTTCRNGDEIVKNPDRPYIQDLDALPFPAHHLFPLEYLKQVRRSHLPSLHKPRLHFLVQLLLCSTHVRQRLPHEKPQKRR